MIILEKLFKPFMRMTWMSHKSSNLKDGQKLHHLNIIKNIIKKLFNTLLISHGLYLIITQQYHQKSFTMKELTKKR